VCDCPKISWASTWKQAVWHKCCPLIWWPDMGTSVSKALVCTTRGFFWIPQNSDWRHSQVRRSIHSIHPATCYSSSFATHLEQHIGYFCLQKEILSLTVVDPHLSFQPKNHNVRESLGETAKTQEKNSIPLTEIWYHDNGQCYRYYCARPNSAQNCRSHSHLGTFGVS
jgi:hypothetical protein